MTRQMVDSILELKEYNRFSKGIFSYVGFKTYYDSYKVEERKGGTTKWNKVTYGKKKESSEYWFLGNSILHDFFNMLYYYF